MSLKPKRFCVVIWTLFSFLLRSLHLSPLLSSSRNRFCFWFLFVCQEGVGKLSLSQKLMKTFGHLSFRKNFLNCDEQRQLLFWLFAVFFFSFSCSGFLFSKTNSDFFPPHILTRHIFKLSLTKATHSHFDTPCHFHIWVCNFMKKMALTLPLQMHFDDTRTQAKLYLISTVAVTVGTTKSTSS